jgi:PPOX class probable F420-dependent enzyme
MTELDQQARAFLESTRTAAMITLRPDGTPHAVRVGIGLVDGRLWNSGTQDRRRTGYLRRDPRSTLFVFDNTWRWLTLECRVRILDGADAAQLNLQLGRAMQASRTDGRLSWFGRDVDEDEFLGIMAEEQRLMYEFDVLRLYGMYGEAP